MKHLLKIFLTIILLQANTIFSQDINNDIKRNNKFFTGGGLGFQFGTVTIIDVSPIIGYMITDNLAIGTSFTYQYLNDKRYSPNYSTNVYGGSLFTRYYMFNDFFAHAEYEILNYDYYTYYFSSNGSFVEKEKMNVTVSNILLWGGYRQLVGGRTYINLMILLYFNESIYSIYSNPIFMIGINVRI